MPGIYVETGRGPSVGLSSDLSGDASQGLVERMFEWMGFPNPRQKARMGSVALRRGIGKPTPSFTELLPYTAYDPDDQVFVLRDGASLGLMFELDAMPTEARSLAWLAQRAAKVQEVLQALPEAQGSPWIAQFFLNDDRDIKGLNDQLREYIAWVHRKEPERQSAVMNSPITQTVLAEVRKHVGQVSKPEGLFTDTQVTGQVWRGQQRRVRCCIYKRFDDTTADEGGHLAQALTQMEATATTLQATLAEAGVRARRCQGKDLYEWLLPFFNPRPSWARDAAELLRLLPYPGDRHGRGHAPDTDGCAPGPDDHARAPLMGCDLSDLLNESEPTSSLDKGAFSFDGVPVRALALQNMRQPPSFGYWSAELFNNDRHYARFDRLPPGSMLSISVEIRPQHVVERHIERIRDASRAQTATARETHHECEEVLEGMIRGEKLFPMALTLYLTGQNQEELDAAISDVNAQVAPTGLRFIDIRHDLAPLDSFIRSLPFNFDPAFDAKYHKRSRLTFASNIAALLPVYGRSRGSAHPGMWFWNRGGEALWLDPIVDRKKNAHMLVLGPTGAGKSATLNYLAMMAMAIHRPRLVIVDAGKSFGLLAEWFQTQGLSTHCVTCTMDADVSLPPFVNACKILDDRDVMASFQAAEGRSPDAEPDPVLSEIDAAARETASAASSPHAQDARNNGEDKGNGEGEDEDDEKEEKRDLLGEMLIAATMMITGGEKREEERMSRADRYLITRAIVRAALAARQEGKAHPLVHDVAIGLMHMQQDMSLSPARRDRAEEMGQAMMSFTDGLRGKLFNRPGQDWPDVDVTLVEMGDLTGDGYGDALAVAYTSLIDSVQSRGERAQYEDRPMIFLTDEGHLITTNDLLGPKLAKATKMWRKLNIWFWLATQNLKDFPDSMDRVLSMCEYWMLLTMDKSEIEEVARFRSLTAEQRQMMESARKEPGKYTEGVIIDAGGQYLFRNVPPALPIALAMTEGREKAARRRIMREHDCTEMQAAQIMAEQLAASRG